MAINMFRKIINHIIINYLNAHKEMDNNYLYNGIYNNRPKIVVYTCITGNYDKKILEPKVFPKNIDYVLFTDNSNVKTSGWKVRKIPKKIVELDNILQNRYIKMHPFEFFSEYDYAIYIDGNVQVLSDLTNLTYCVNKKTGIAMHQHQFRDCIYNEVKVCKILNKGNSIKLDKQIKKYKKEGMPKHFGMFEATIIVSDTKSKNAKMIYNSWWKEFIESGSLRDQISLHYVIWQHHLNINDFGCLGNNLYKNPEFKVNIHK